MGEPDFSALVTRVMTRLAHLRFSAVALAGALSLAAILIVDSVARDKGVRLVPLYVPALCVICWALGARRGVLFAIVAAAVAVVPDALESPTPLGAATVVSTVIRALAYVFLAIIIAACRNTYDDADVRAMHDGLTLVLNKMSFHATAQRYLLVAERNGQTVVAAYVDLDEFKAINTTYGHAAGDLALLTFGREAMDAIRGSDLVGRLGGDEFGFLLNVSSDEHAEGLVHLLHQRVTTALAKTGLPLTCSMGAAIIAPGSALREADVFKAADRIMERAKQAGKNTALAERITVQVVGGNLA